MIEKIKKYQVIEKTLIRSAIKQMDKVGNGFCVCVDNNEKVIGVISDGDFRRAILKGVQLDEPIENIMNHYLKSTCLQKT